ncbi:MAG: CBS domain-containing protein, partial [Gammaproteobacteria bacterium]
MAGKIPKTLIRDIRIRKPVRIKTDTPLVDVVAAMKKGRRGAAIIEDQAGKLIGIITERDLIARVDHSTTDWQNIPVDEVMIRVPWTIKMGGYLHEAVGVMVTKKIRHLPVVDADNHVAGIVSIRDIIAHVASLYPREFLNLPPAP